MEVIEITLGLLLCVAIVAALGKWVPLPLPLLHLAAGVGLSYIPAFRAITVPPDVFFLLFIPPLLFADGWLIPKRDLVRVLRPVLLLAFGLVLLTVFAVGLLMHWLIPSMPLAAAFALGAVISPTDAVAVSAITSKLKVPVRVTTIIGGESLINDASGLVAFKFAVAAVVTGTISWTNAAEQFVLLSGGGLLLGLAVAWTIGQMRAALTRYHIDDPIIQTVISLLTPYAAYIAAETAGVGSILAVVASGLYSGSHDMRHLNAATRAHAWEVWSMLLFVFNGLVFVLLGVELHSVVAGVSRASLGQLAVAAAVLWVSVVVLRLLWVYPGAYLPLLLSRRLREREGVYPSNAVFLVGWAGIRGSVTLAAALSIPLVTATGEAFPGRDLIIVLAASVIVATLLINGLSLPLFIRWLKIHGDGIAGREERAARLATTQAVVDELRRQLPRLKHPEEITFAKSLIEKYEHRLQRHSANADRRRRLEAMYDSQRKFWMEAINAGRTELMEMRESGEINDEVLRVLQTDFDLEEALIVGAPRHEH
jgi:monovalent cation/hydrogen antiporter